VTPGNVVVYVMKVERGHVVRKIHLSFVYHDHWGRVDVSFRRFGTQASSELERRAQGIVSNPVCDENWIFNGPRDGDSSEPCHSSVYEQHQLDATQTCRFCGIRNRNAIFIAAHTSVLVAALLFPLPRSRGNCPPCQCSISERVTALDSDSKG
jgi:hypothetical protein